MKEVFNSSLFLTGFTGSVLLGHLFVAYPAIRAGVSGLIFLLFVALVVLAGVCVMLARRARGIQMARQDLHLALVPAGVGFAVLVSALILGVLVGA